jgi:hypothetical protein
LRCCRHPTGPPIPIQQRLPEACLVDVKSAREVPDRDLGRLCVSAPDGIHVFDLHAGTREVLVRQSGVSALAVSADSQRLFAITERAVHMIEVRTGSSVVLVAAGKRGSTFRAGAVSRDAERSGRFGRLAATCLLDVATLSLVLCDAHRIVRLRGVQDL